MKNNNKTSQQQYSKAYTGSSFGLSSPQNNKHHMNNGQDQSNIRALVQKYQAFDSNQDEEEDNVYLDNNDQQDNYDNEYEQDYEDQQMQIQQNQLQLQELQNNQYNQDNNVFQSSGKSGQKMLLVNNANTTNNVGAQGNVVSYSTPQQQQQQLINLNINNNSQMQIMQQQQMANNVYQGQQNSHNGDNGQQVNFFNSYHQHARMNHLLQSSNTKKVSSNTKNSSYRYQIRTIRPQSAKPISKDRYQIQNGNESSALYGQTQQNEQQQQFQVFKNKTVKNDNTDRGTEMARYFQIKSKLNAKLGVPYLESIKAIQRQDYGITMYQPKQNMGTRIRPMSGKATQSTQVALQNLSQDQMINPSIQQQQQQQQQQSSQVPKKTKLHGNRSLTRRPSNDHQSIYVNLNMNLDKEQLYQASITLKGELNICLNENQNLKTQLQFLSKELNNREKMINEVITTGKLQNRMNDNTLLSFKLKQQLRELQQLMKTKDAEIELLKRNIRSTRLEEAEQIVQVYMQEGVRLRQQLQDALNMSNQRNLSATTSQHHDQQTPQNQQRIQELNQMIQQLQLTLQGKDQELQLWKQRCDKQLQQASEMSQSKPKLSKSGNTSQYIQKDEYDHVKQKVRDLQTKYDEILLENQSLKEQVQSLINDQQILIEKDDKIQQLQSEISSQEQVIQIISDEKNQLQEQVNGLQNQNDKLKEKINKSIIKYEDQISELKEQLENQIQDHIQDDNEIEKLKQQHKSQLKEQSEKLRAKFNKEFEQQKSEMTQQLQNTINESELKVQNLQQEHQNIINQLQQQMEDFTNQLKNGQQNMQQLIHQESNSSLTQRQFTKQLTNKSQQSVQDQQQQQQSQSRRSIITSNSNSQYQTTRKSLQSNNQPLEKLPLIKEDQILKFYEKIKRVLQLEKIQKDQVSNYIFSDNLENREDISIKDFSQILYMKFQLDQKDALNFARFVIEQPSQQEQLDNEIEYNPSKTLVNRKLIKFLYDKVLGPSYQLFSPDQEQHVLKKYRELAQPHYDNLESTLALYDEEEKGVINADDLREGLVSFDIYDGKDKVSLECFTLYLLTLNHKSNDQIRIQDVLESLYPDRQVSVSKSSIISKKLTQNTAIINRSQTLNQQITQQKSTVRFMETQQSLKNQKTVLKSSQHQIQEEINNNNNNNNIIIDNEDKMSNQIIEDDYDQDNYEQEEILSQQDINNNNPTLIKSMNEEELLQKSEIAFQLITQHLQKHNLSLRNVLQNHIYDKKIAIIQDQQQPIDESDNVQINKQEIDKTFEVINAQDFFDKLQIYELSQSLQDSVIQIAAKPLNNNTEMIFIYKDLEEILGAYGFEDQSKPRNSRNMKYDQLDQKSIRIMNRFQSYLENNIRTTTLRELFADKIYKKTINNSQLGSSSSKKQFKLEFIKSKDFFEILHSINVRKSTEPHKNLQIFLTIDSKIYKQGLVFKKLERLLKECQENQYLQSVGTQKKLRQSFAKQSSQIHQDQIIEEEDQYEEDHYEDLVSDKYSDNLDNKQGQIQSPNKNHQESNLENNNNTITRNMSEIQSPQKKDTMSSILMQTQFNSGKKCLTSMVIKEEESQLNSHQTQRQKTSIAEMQRHYEEDLPKKIINIDSESLIALRSRDGNLDSQQIVNQYSESIIDDVDDHYSEQNNDDGDMEF